MAPHPRLASITLQGYRPFKDFHASFGSLEVVVGANGSGKSALFEFLKVLRDGLDSDLPPGLIAGGSVRKIYHATTAEVIGWNLNVRDIELPLSALSYSGELSGPFGRDILGEHVHAQIDDQGGPLSLMESRHGEGEVYNTVGADGGSFKFSFSRTNRLALGSISNPAASTLLTLQEYIRRWGFYSSFNIDADTIRRPVLLDENPLLKEDGGNLSAVLQYLRNEYQEAFDELSEILRLLVPGFKSLRLRGYGGQGQVMAFWEEEGSDDYLSLADLSDGTLRLICWALLCVMPNPPSLICIDEPDQGLHPRTLPILAALFEKASNRTQVVIATHNSYFLSQFDFSRIAVMRKEEGQARFIKPKDSKVLSAILDEFGSDELEVMHRSNELERLP